jgi:TRAP-type C4-dicarboxylate transport system substrate-binding protein
MMNVPLAVASGAVVITKKKFDQLPADLQEILVRNGKQYLTELTRKSRGENLRSIETMKRNGLQIVEVKSTSTLKEFDEVGRRARRSLVGRLYDQSLLDRAEKAVADARTSAGK